MPNTTWWQPAPPKTKFAPKFKVPFYVANDGSPDFIERMKKYVLDLEENIISKEELVSEVPKPEEDPYQHTQQWKQHNLLHDFAGYGGENLVRFPEDPVQQELFNIIRTHYLTFLAECGYPRIKIYIHAWANILRKGQWISKHTHMEHDEAYLACAYYLTTNDTNLYLANTLKDVISVKTVARKMIFFPSWVMHWSDEYEGDDLRISLAFDLVTEGTMKGNPWRPHILFDDPETMPGLDGK